MKCETIYIALIGLVLAACNGDVFVDDYLPHGAATVLMSEDNRTAEIIIASLPPNVKRKVKKFFKFSQIVTSLVDGRAVLVYNEVIFGR